MDSQFTKAIAFELTSNHFQLYTKTISVNSSDYIYKRFFDNNNDEMANMLILIVSTINEIEVDKILLASITQSQSIGYHIDGLQTNTYLSCCDTAHDLATMSAHYSIERVQHAVQIRHSAVVSECSCKQSTTDQYIT